jgi:hypothetical protein
MIEHKWNLSMMDGSLETLESQIRDRMKDEQSWGGWAIEAILANYEMGVEMKARARRLNRQVHSCSVDDWDAIVRSYVWEQLLTFQFEQVTDFVHCLRRIVTFSAANALRDHLRGTRSRSGQSSRLLPMGDFLENGSISEGRAEEGLSSDATNDPIEIPIDWRMQTSSFLIRELEHCIADQIKMFSPSVQHVLTSLALFHMKACDVARDSGVTEGRIAQVKKEHYPRLQRLVRERCLGDR